jgi:general secretion pathway protein J
MRTSRQGSAGFTLVELLVSLTLMAILSVLLAGAVRTGARAAAGGERRMDDAGQVVIAQSVALRLLSALLPVAEPGAEGLAFDGRPDGVEFIGLPPALSAPGGFYRLALLAERQGADLRLVLRSRAIAESAAANQTVLLDRLAHIEFAYFGIRSDGEAAQWHDDWRANANLPTRIRIRFRTIDGQDLPDLVVALRLAGSVRHERDMAA